MVQARPGAHLNCQREQHGANGQRIYPDEHGQRKRARQQPLKLAPPQKPSSLRRDDG